MIKGIAEDILRRVYDFSEMTNEELRCRFFQKLEECIETCNSTSEVVDWLKNEGLEQEVNDFITKLLEDGTIANLINATILSNKVDKEEFNTTTETINNNLDNINKQLTNKATKNDLEVERNRINNLTQLQEGSTTGDAELIDGRIGADSYTYTTIGQSIRSQIGRINDELFTNIGFNKLNLTFITGNYNLNGEIVTGDTNFRSEINVKPGEIYKIKGGSFWQMPLYVILNNSGTMISKFPTTATNEVYEKEVSITESGKLVINYSTKRVGSDEQYKPVCYKKVFNSKINEVENKISNNKALIINNSNKLNDFKNLVTTEKYNEIKLQFEDGATNISGSNLSDSAYKHCDIEINTLLKYKVVGYNYWQMPLYLILDGEGNILTKYPESASDPSLIEKELTSFPNGAKTLRVNYTSNYAGTGEEYKSKCYKNNTLFNEEDNPLFNLGKTNIMTSIFIKYGIIGDSLSSGAQDLEGGRNAIDMPQYSWASFLEKSTGCETVRLCRGGLQLKNWHASFESKARQEENKCSAYIIMLGHNDASTSLGTIADVNLSNLSNSKDTTQFGMYGRLIGTLRDISPKCKIFCVTYPIYYVENYGTNNIARTFANTIPNCYCIDLWQVDKNRKTVTNTSFATPNPYFSKLHGTVLGYKHWGDIINSYIDYIIRNNLNDFTDVGYINTDYTFE